MNLIALAAAQSLPPTAKNIESLAAEFGLEDARWAVSQWELRRRGSVKFALTEQMLFDRDGLEMSTHERVAAFHASLFPPNVEVIDLTTGIGADLIALARRGTATGYEIDPERAELARHNLRVHGIEAEIKAESHPSGPIPFFFADPARRAEGRRKSLRPEDYEPPLSSLAELAQAAEGAVIKLSPLVEDRTLENLGAQIVFVSFDRECREALALFGSCQTKDGGVWAYHVDSEEWLESNATTFTTDAAGAWLYEMDPAAIRAHTNGSFDLMPLGDSNGYLTGDEEIESPWLRRYRVLSSGRADIKETRSTLEKLGSATPVIKQRGAGTDIEKTRKSLQLKGNRPLILAVWSVGKSLRHTILEST